MTLTPERIEEILNAETERSGHYVATSDYDALVRAYRDLLNENKRLRAEILGSCAVVPAITKPAVIVPKRVPRCKEGVPTVTAAGHFTSWSTCGKELPCPDHR